MNNQKQTPELKESGSDGTQVQGDTPSKPELVEAQSLGGLQMAQTITGLAASNTRAFGGEVTSALIAGATTQLASELQYTKNEVSGLRKKNDALKENLSKTEIQKAVLEERIDSYRANRHLRHFGIAIGTSLIGIGFQLIHIKLATYGCASLTVGALLLILGWQSSPKGGDK